MNFDFQKILNDIKDIFGVNASLDQNYYTEASQLRIGADAPNIYLEKIDLKTKVVIQRFVQHQYRSFETLGVAEKRLDLLRSKTQRLIPEDTIVSMKHWSPAEAEYPLLETYENWAIVVDDQVIVNCKLEPADLTTTIKVLQKQNTREVPVKEGVLYGNRIDNISIIVFSKNKIDDVDREIITLQTIWISHLLHLSHAFSQRDKLSKSLQKSNQALQVKTGELSKALDAKAIFLAHMSHEIRTPLNGILGAAQLLEESQLTPQQRELINIQIDSGQHLHKIIDAILDLSKIEAGVFEISPERFDLRQLIERCYLNMLALVEKKSLQIKLNIELETPHSVKGDETRIRQSLLNLLSNAIKFTDSGEIVIIVKPLDEEQYLIEVQDQGIGIDAEDVEVLFSPFRQDKGQSGRSYGGTGLGLPLVRQFCRLHGGDAGAYPNKQQEGATFWMTVRLPRDQVSHTVELEVDDQYRKLNKELSVLVVDDNHVNRMIATKILKSMDCTVELARNGQEAVDLIQQSSGYDIILMDCMMPIMDGFTATKKIREALKEKSMPIYALTAAVTKEEREMCYQSGMDGILFKPVKKYELEKLFVELFPV